MRTRVLLFSVLLLLCVSCDHATKRVATSLLGQTDAVSLVGDAVRFELAYNPGAFLSLGAGLSPELRRLLLVGLVPIGIAIVCVSTGAPFARWAAPAPPLAIAALRVGLASLLLFGAGWREIQQLRAVPSRDRGLIVLSGALLAIRFGSWIASLSFTSTAASVALVATNPMFAALFGTLLGDRVTRRDLAGIAIAAAGCAVLAGGDWQAGGDALIGDGLALIGAASAAAYLVVGRRLRVISPADPAAEFTGTESRHDAPAHCS